MAQKLLYAFLLFFLSSCANYISGQKKTVPPYVLQIKDTTQFKQLEGEPLTNFYSGVNSIKMCYDLQSKILYFINSKQYRFHIDFCNEQLFTTYEVDEFNNQNYGNTTSRRFLLGTYNYYAFQNKYTLEFVSEDDVPLNRLLEMHALMVQKIEMHDSLFVLINNSFLQNHAKSEYGALPLIYPEQLFTGQSFQPLVQGQTFGTVRVIADLKKEYNTVGVNDIIFIDGSPLSIPTCAAVITSTLQTPLSHINVLCNNRNTPASAWRDCKKYIKDNNLNNKPILLEVNKDGVSITPITDSALKRLTLIEKYKKQKLKVVLKADTSYNKLDFFKTAFKIPNNAIGSKAQGVKSLYSIQQKYPSYFKVPDGAFAIPFYYYKQHLSNTKIKRELNNLNGLLKTNYSITQLDSVLKLIRNAIKEQELSATLLKNVLSNIKKSGTTKSYRFRSSSNAEDLKGFNGAGLYNSYTGIYNDNIKPIEAAIKKVWASTFTLAAFRERQLYGIAENTVMMGVLVHQGFNSETANGVAITKNITRKDFPGFTINVQKSEISVVQPLDSVVCDQLIILPSETFSGVAGDVYAQYITHSNMNGGVNVLSIAQTKKLFFALQKIKEYYYFVKMSNLNASYDNYGLDLEFKFQDDELYIKQVRPYN
jgi:pyruvate, water dikinase